LFEMIPDIVFVIRSLGHFLDVGRLDVKDPLIADGAIFWFIRWM
jgi:hypothetical protein